MFIGKSHLQRDRKNKLVSLPNDCKGWSWVDPNQVGRSFFQVSLAGTEFQSFGPCCSFYRPWRWMVKWSSWTTKWYPIGYWGFQRISHWLHQGGPLDFIFKCHFFSFLFLSLWSHHHLQVGRLNNVTDLWSSPTFTSLFSILFVTLHHLNWPIFKFTDSSFLCCASTAPVPFLNLIAAVFNNILIHLHL